MILECTISSRTDESLRVLHLLDSLRVGGKERQAVELLKGLSRIPNVQLMVVTMGDEQFYVPDLEALNIPLLFMVRRMRWDPFIFLRLWRTLLRFRPHILHTNSDIATFYALPLAKLLRIKLVTGFIRGALPPKGLRGQSQKLLLYLSDVVVANSKAGLDSVGLYEDHRKTYVIYNGFDFARFEAARDRTNQDPLLCFTGKNVVGMVAEFSHFKDYTTYFSAARLLLQKRRDVVFIAVGGGENLHAYKQSEGMDDDCIRFLGERRDIEAIVKLMDIGVLCTYNEGISNSVMEYMAAGKPSVVTDGGGSRELVVDGHTGFLVPPVDPHALAHRIELLLDNPDLRMKMGSAGTRLLADRFSLKQLAENTMRMYLTSIRRGQINAK